MFVYDDDVLDTFQTFFCYLPQNSSKMFYHVINNPRTVYWYSSLNVSMKVLTRMLKDMHVDVEGITNKSSQTTCMTRMTIVGVPAQIGMQITGHKFEGAYRWYDLSPLLVCLVI